MLRQNRQRLTTIGKPFWALLTAILLTILASAALLGADETAPQLALVPLVTNVDSPVFLADAGDERLFVVEKGGRVLIFEDGALLSRPFLDLSTKVAACRECGLLSMAFAPDYATSGVFYVYYTAAADLAEPSVEGEPNGSNDTVVARFQVSENPNQADMTTEEPILIVNQPYFNHNGGLIAFGPDGYFYVGLGDGGSGGDPQNLAQNPASLLGKMLRIDVGSSGAYAIPPSNPYVSDPAYRDEIWAVGLRNPWRYSFDRLTGDLYIGDVGQDDYEEINFQPANSDGGENYGWNLFEGNHCYRPQTPCDDNGLTKPIIEYDHGLGWSVTGGHVYRGASYPGLQGIYLYADYGSGTVWGAASSNNGWQSQVLLEAGQRSELASFAEDDDGELYLVDMAGTIYAIVDPSSLELLYLPLLTNQ